MSAQCKSGDNVTDESKMYEEIKEEENGSFAEESIIIVG